MTKLWWAGGQEKELYFHFVNGLMSERPLITEKQKSESPQIHVHCCIYRIVWTIIK